MWASLKITHAFVLLQAALFLGLGVLFSLVSIPLVIYDWACSSSSDEGHWDQLRTGIVPARCPVMSPHISNLSSLLSQVYRSKQKFTRHLKWNNTSVAKQKTCLYNGSCSSKIWDRFQDCGVFLFFFFKVSCNCISQYSSQSVILHPPNSIFCDFMVL